MLSNRYFSSEKSTLVENEKIITDDKELAKVINDVFSNIMKTLNNPQINSNASNFENVKEPTLTIPAPIPNKEKKLT